MAFEGGRATLSQRRCCILEVCNGEAAAKRHQIKFTCVLFKKRCFAMPSVQRKSLVKGGLGLHKVINVFVTFLLALLSSSTRTRTTTTTTTKAVQTGRREREAQGIELGQGSAVYWI